MVGARERAVFIKCPFDMAYKPLFDAIVFTIASCKFRVRSALELSDAGEARLAKIVRLIGESRPSIHDISRIALSDGLPRFNMPIELGIAIGARHFGEAGAQPHQLLVIDSDRYRYQRFASDLAGMDIHAHGGEVIGAITATRDFLVTQTDEPLPGASSLHSAMQRFETALPRFAAAARQSIEELTFIDRLRHLLAFITETQ